MKVSEYLRQYKETKQLPEVGDDEMLHFWGGWLIGRAAPDRNTDFLSEPDNINGAIHAAEFIEKHALSGIAGVEVINTLSKEEAEKIWPKE